MENAFSLFEYPSARPELDYRCVPSFFSGIRSFSPYPARALELRAIAPDPLGNTALLDVSRRPPPASKQDRPSSYFGTSPASTVPGVSTESRLLVPLCLFQRTPFRPAFSCIFFFLFCKWGAGEVEKFGLHSLTSQSRRVLPFFPSEISSKVVTQGTDH